MIERVKVFSRQAPISNHMRGPKDWFFCQAIIQCFCQSDQPFGASPYGPQQLPGDSFHALTDVAID